MKTKPIQRSLSLLSALALLLTVFAVPAFAAPSQATATAGVLSDDRLVLAGTSRNLGDDPFDVVVENTASAGLPILGGGGPSIDFIQVIVPEWHTTIGDVTIAPAGDWDLTVDRDNNAIIARGGSLSPGSSATISYGGTVTGDLADDDFGPIGVDVSENGGSSTAFATPSEPGALTIDIDVLDLSSITATGPSTTIEYGDGQTFTADATDGTVTAGQDNVDLALDVINLSTEDKTVGIKKLDGASGGTETPAMLAARSADTDDDQGAITLAGVTFGSAGAVVVDADIEDADGTSDRLRAADPLEVTVEQAVGVTKRADITPDFVGTGNREFTIQLDKNGVPSTLVDATLEFTGLGLTGPTATIDDVLIDRGSQQLTLNATVSWDPDVHTDGDFTATLDLEGIDDNGAPVDLGPIDLGPVTFDSLVPFVQDLVLTAPDAQVGEGTVATNGSTLGFTGTVIDPVTDGDHRPCSDCTVTLELVEGTTSYHELQVTPDDQGEISGSFSVSSFPDRRDFFVSLAATVTDRAGNATTTPVHSNPVAVDTLRPAVFRAGTEGTNPPENWDDGQAGEPDYTGGAEGARVRALTGGETEDDQRIIDVVFDEPIGGGTSALHWFVDSNGQNIGVESAEIVDNRKVRLTLLQDFGRNARGVVTYDPALALSSQRIFDRAGLTLNGGLADTIDNIVPLAIDITTIDGLSLYTPTEGSTPKFHTNVSTYTADAEGNELKQVNEEIEFVVSSLPAGSAVNVRVEDGEANREISFSNPSTNDMSNVLFSKPLEAVFGSTDEGPNLSNRELNLVVWVTDSGPKPGPEREFPLVLDRADPISDGATVDMDANSVTASANEPLRFGRNAASDWILEVLRGTRAEKIAVNEVLTTADPATRQLLVDADTHPFSRYDLQAAQYRFLGSPEERLADPAGNRLTVGTLFEIP